MALNIYPVTQTELAYKDYDIKINGIAATPDVARVSAVPFNRRWPGHQRQLEQTELINFLSLSTDEPLHFEITPHQPFEDVVIRPWGSDEWVKPTVDIYERDCKGIRRIE